VACSERQPLIELLKKIVIEGEQNGCSCDDSGGPWSTRSLLIPPLKSVIVATVHMQQVSEQAISYSIFIEDAHCQFMMKEVEFV
jgi:hypothetical protein